MVINSCMFLFSHLFSVQIAYTNKNCAETTCRRPASKISYPMLSTPEVSPRRHIAVRRSMHDHNIYPILSTLKISPIRCIAIQESLCTASYPAQNCAKTTYRRLATGISLSFVFSATS
ncbi:hypothetical protein IW262DRAFT_1497836, partial [Armillaria fumosa]